MDRQAWIVVSLCVVGLVTWQVYMTSHAPRIAPPAATAPAPAIPAPAASAAETPAQVAPAAAPSPAPEVAESVPVFEEKSESLRNNDVELLLTNRGGGISEARLLNHTTKAGQVVLNSPERVPIGAVVEQPAAPLLAEFAMARQADGSVQLERVAPGGLTVRKRFYFPPTTEKKDNFVVMMDLDFRNDGAQPYASSGYFLALGSAAPIYADDMPSYTRVVWCTDGKASGIDVGWFDEQKIPLLGIQKREALAFYQQKSDGAQWAGMSNNFFATLLTPLNAKVTEVWARRFDTKKAQSPQMWGIEGAMGMPGFTLEPGQTNTIRLQLWTGPKLYGGLAKLTHDEAEIMNFGFFKFFSQFLLNLMNSLQSFVKDYGLAIILLTAIVKAVLWPLQNKANYSMRRMSLLSPKMQELREKYKDDPTKMNQEVMKLYKEYGVNPVSGCLPMMIQIPVFFGLFSMLGQAAELRNASFLWVHDLSQPDTIGFIPGLGWRINLLPILMGATNVWLMQMTPKTGDATQRRILMFMPLIFLIFCYNFAAALALYYTTQNLFTILQLWHNQRQPMPTLEKVAPAGKRANKKR